MQSADRHASRFSSAPRPGRWGTRPRTSRPRSAPRSTGSARRWRRIGGSHDPASPGRGVDRRGLLSDPAMKKNLPLLVLATVVAAALSAEFLSPIAMPSAWYVGYAIGWGLCSLAATFLLAGVVAGAYRLVAKKTLTPYWLVAWIVWVIVTSLAALGGMAVRARSVERFLAGG